MSERIYAWLLKLYPASFRRTYGAAALQLFRDRLQAERGVLRRLRFWVDVIVDLCIWLPREHWRPKAPAPGGESSFRIPNEAARALTQRDALFPAILVNLFLLIGLTIGWLGNSSHAVLSAAYIPLVSVGVMQFQSIRRARERWRSYELVLETDRIQQKDCCRNETVLRSQIVKINEDQHGLAVIGRTVIWIPAGLTGYQDVRAQVLHWSDSVSQRGSLWLRDLRQILVCAASLLPALLAVRSLPWFVVAAGIYYGLILLAIMIHVLRPPRNSGLARRSVPDLPPLPYLWRRFKHSVGNPAVIALLILPMVRMVLP